MKPASSVTGFARIEIDGYAGNRENAVESLRR
jgi:hypothetical protein